jgi:hypothetical protein
MKRLDRRMKAIKQMRCLAIFRYALLYPFVDELERHGHLQSTAEAFFGGVVSSSAVRRSQQCPTSKLRPCL